MDSVVESNPHSAGRIARMSRGGDSVAGPKFRSGPSAVASLGPVGDSAGLLVPRPVKRDGSFPDVVPRHHDTPGEIGRLDPSLGLVEAVAKSSPEDFDSRLVPRSEFILNRPGLADASVHRRRTARSERQRFFPTGEVAAQLFDDPWFATSGRILPRRTKGTGRMSRPDCIWPPRVRTSSCLGPETSS